MNLVVFGASGRCGRELVKLARARDHAVTAVARAETPLEVDERVRVLRGDVLDEGFVEGAVADQDAVASALGIRYAHPWARLGSPRDFTSRATACIVRAMRARGVRRIVAISAAGVGDSRAALNWPMRVLLRASNVGIAYAALEETERELADSGLDWQAVRPTTLSHRPASGRIELTARFGTTASISCADVAAFMLGTLEAPAIDDRTPMITNAA